jgi:hypothetical protein
MRFALKVVPLAVLGCAAALLVACGDRSGLLSSSQSASLQDSLSTVQSACADGNAARAQIAAQGFADRVDALSSGAVDRRLLRNLEDGASTLRSLVSRTCTGTTSTTPATTATTTTTPTTTTVTTTTTPTSTTTTPTTPTTTTTPTPPTTPSDNGGGTPGGSDGEGNGVPGNPGGAAPGQLKKALKEFEKESRR